MEFKTIEDLPVWKTARDLAVRVFDLTSSGSLGPHPGLRDQLERATISISNNIAEGYERGSTAELLAFLYYARGSAGEVRSMLAILDLGREWSGIRAEIAHLHHLTYSISRQLGAWIESTKNSKWKGSRYQDQDARDRRAQDARRDAFLEELDQLQAAARQKWESELKRPATPPPPVDPNDTPAS